MTPFGNIVGAIVMLGFGWVQLIGSDEMRAFYRTWPGERPGDPGERHAEGKRK